GNQWQALDSATAKAPLGGDETGPHPTDRRKSSSKRHLITEGQGIPVGTALSSANRHDMKKAAETVDAIVTERPSPEEQEQHLCTDKGYDYPETRQEMAERGYQVHIPQRGLDTPVPEPGAPNRHPARRWVVERTHSWFNRFRKLLIRWEKKAEHWLGLIQLAACLTVYRHAFLG
ncbi:IS5 family transposase, partial [Dehalococcoidia bacterium]|nr:IS5 family transposase [Dehalococcoidia bacterium]